MKATSNLGISNLSEHKPDRNEKRLLFLSRSKGCVSEESCEQKRSYVKH